MSGIALKQRISTPTFNFPSNPSEFPIINGQTVILECETSGTPIIITFPTISKIAGDNFSVSFQIIDVSNNAGTNNITINLSGGNTFFGGSSSYKISNDGGGLMLVMIGNQFAIIPLPPAVNGGTQIANIFQTKVNITPAQILALNITPVTIVPAQGVGKIIKLIGSVFTMRFNSTPYLTGGALTTLNYGVLNTTVLAYDTAFITSAKDAIYDSPLFNPASFAPAIISGTPSGSGDYENQPLQIKASAPITVGDSNITGQAYWIAIKM